MERPGLPMMKQEIEAYRSRQCAIFTSHGLHSPFKGVLNRVTALRIKQASKSSERLAEGACFLVWVNFLNEKGAYLFYTIGGYLITSCMLVARGAARAIST
jgi:hypothetical protein